MRHRLDPAGRIETASGALKTLMARGAISKEGCRYRLNDLSVLQQLVTQAPAVCYDANCLHND